MELNHLLLHVGQVSLPLDHEIALSVTEVGVEPTESRGSRPRRFSCLRTRPSTFFVPPEAAAFKILPKAEMAGPGVAPDGRGL